MSSKAVTKWTLEIFLCVVVVVAGMIIALLAMSWIFVPKICPKGQEDEILKVMNKVEEVKGRPGYEVIYFEVKKECVDYVKYDGRNKVLIVNYTTAGEVEYPSEFTWNIGELKPGKYPLEVHADGVWLMGVD